MRLLFIRHGDPDYVNDCLLESGRIEAQALAPRLAGEKMDYVYVSPLGRARETMEIALPEPGVPVETFDWLREFNVDGMVRPHDTKPVDIVWDWRPADWMTQPVFFDKDSWWTQEAFAAIGVKKEYDHVINGFDALMARHGYVRNGAYYKVEKSNNDTLVFFCHLGVTLTILSHLLNISPMILWHGFAPAPTSLTTVYTEERQRGIASFRVAALGDISHLNAAGLEPSFMCRFCEQYSDPTRHD